MRERLLNHQQKPRPFGMKTRRLNAVTRFLMVLFTMMLFPMTLFSQGAIDPDYYEYDTQAGKFNKVTINSYNLLSDADNGPDGYTLYTGRTYVSTGGDNFNKRVFISVSGMESVINIILRDGTSVMAMKGIDVPSGVTLNIYAQEAGTGMLNAQGCDDDNSTGYGGTGHFYGAAIGGSYDTNPSSNYSSITRQCGTINIHGGQIEANSSLVDYAAGIGGCGGEGPVGLNIYGGKVTATGGKYGAGIGGGGIHGDSGVSSNGGTVSIYGGEVVATGGSGDAANVVAMGIGRGSVSNTATSGPSQGGLTLNTGVIYYGGTTANPTNKISDGTRFQYMKTIRTYDLWLGKKMSAEGTQVTAANASNLLGSLAGATGSMSFSPYTNTLTLNNAAFGQNIISGLDDLTIEFSGANSIILDGDTGTIIRSTNKDATLTFTHTGTADSLYLRHLNYYDGNNFSIISGFESIDYSTAGLYIKSYSPTKYVSYNTGAGAVLKSLVSAASRVSRRTNPNNEEITYPCINSATITTTQTYPVWVTGIQVTADNINNILGTASPSVYYDDTNKLLTLDGADIDYTGTSRGAVVSGIQKLKVLLLNNNVISIQNNYDSNYPDDWRIFNYAFQYYAGTDGELTFILDEANNSSLGQLTIKNMEDPSATDPQVAIGYAPFVVFGSNQQSVADLTSTGSGWIKTTATSPKNSLTLSYFPEDYDLWVAGTRVNSFNAGNVLNTKNSSGAPTVKYDATTNKLTLNNAQLTEGIWTTMANLNIHIVGSDCWIRPTTKNTNCILSTADSGVLKFTKENDGDKLVLNNGYNGIDNTPVRGFSSIDNSGLPLETRKPYQLVKDGYYCLKDVLANDTSVNYAIVSANTVYPLWLSDRQVTSANASNIIGWASFDSGTNTLTLTGLNSNVGGSSGKPNYGVTTGIGDLKIKLVALDSDQNIIKCGGTDDYAFKGYGSASTITFIPDASNPGSLIMNVANSDGAHWFDGVTPSYSGTLTIYDDGYDGSTYYVSRIAPITNYDLWVCGTQVTSANASNIFNNGRAIYTAATNTLTLVGSTGSSVTTLSSSGIPIIKSGLANLNVILQDGVRFDCTGAYAFEGTLSGATVTFNPGSTTSGSLLFHDSNDFYKDITPIYQGGLAFFGSSTIGRSVIRLSPWSGTGTSADPFLIKTPADLNSLATYVNTDQYTMDHYFKVDNDIDCSNAGTMESIGSSSYYSFKGTFDGNNGKKISNQTTPYGLFGYVGDGCVIKDLVIDNCNVIGSSSDDCVAGLVAQIRTSSAEINNCHVVNSSISSGNNANITSAGGIVGYQWSGTVTGCSVKNSTITLTQQDRTYDQDAGGISAYFYQGTISNCVVEGTTISSQNTGNKELYSGAIVGKVRSSSTTLSNNTYNVAVQVRSKKGSEDEIVRNGNAQRGIGYDESSIGTINYDVFTNNGAVLSGTMSKLTVSAATNGSVEFVDGYYRVDGNDVYALPYSVSNQLTRIKGTSGVDYDSPAITITPTGAAAISPTSTTTGSDAVTGADNATWSIPMPDVDATATVTFPIDLGNGSREFTIDDFTYNGSGQAVTEIKTKKTSTSTNEITLSLTNGDITFVDYLSSTGESLASTYTQANPPSAAGNYKISIKTGNITIGSCEVAYKINAATATITAGDQKVTYTRAGQAYSGVTNCPGSYSVTYYPTEADRTNNSNGYTTPLPVNAGDYFVKVTQTDPNYTSSPVDAKFTIEAIEAQFTWGTTQFDYDGNPHAPTASVSNIVDGDACSVTVSGQQTNVGSSYTATISGLGSTNYKLPATAPSTTFSINPIAVGLSWTNTSFTFDGDAHKPTATATGLVGSDVCNVTVTGEQTNASATAYTATATALDNNNYKLPAAVTQTFTITPCSLASARIDDISAQTYTYSGSEIMPTPGVGIKLGKSTTETPLSAGTDFEYTYANNKNAAKANDNLPPTVTITGKGNYNGTRVVKFTIDQVDMSTSTDITIEAVPDQTYTGSAITPTPTVKFKGNDLVAGTGNDFVYGYLNNTNAALSTDPTAPPTVTITGSGNFKNSTSVKFTILDRTASVTFGSGQTYKTFFSAGENLLVPNDVKAYVVTMVSGNTVNLTQISYIHSNVPVLLESSAGATNVKDPNESLPATNLLKYASAAVSTDGNQYVLYSGEFVKATGTIPADRVYLAYSSPVRRLTIERNNSATAIEAVSDEDADDEQWYDMQGRKINKPTKAGLYIKNGKKVVVNNK